MNFFAVRQFIKGINPVVCAWRVEQTQLHLKWRNLLGKLYTKLAEKKQKKAGISAVLRSK